MIATSSAAVRVSRVFSVVAKMLETRELLREFMGEAPYREQMTRVLAIVRARMAQTGEDDISASLALAKEAPHGSTVAQLFAVAPLEINNEVPA